MRHSAIARSSYTVLANAFIGRTTTPTDADLSAALGRARPAWGALLAELMHKHGVDALEWKCYSIKQGWSLRVMRKKRTIVWLSPGNGGFNAGFILGGKAMTVVRAERQPLQIQQALNTARKYPEGTGLQLIVRSTRSVPALLKLAAIKIDS